MKTKIARTARTYGTASGWWPIGVFLAAVVTFIFGYHRYFILDWVPLADVDAQSGRNRFGLAVRF